MSASDSGPLLSPLDWDYKPIPGLYAVGEVTGGSSMHGLSRGLIMSYTLGKKLAALK